MFWWRTKWRSYRRNQKLRKIINFQAQKSVFLKFYFCMMSFGKTKSTTLKSIKFCTRIACFKKFRSNLQVGTYDVVFSLFPKNPTFVSLLWHFHKNECHSAKKQYFFRIFCFFGSWHILPLTVQLLRVTQCLVSAQSWREHKIRRVRVILENFDVQPEVWLHRKKQLAHQKELTSVD